MEMITIEQACRELGIPKARIRYWIEVGKVPSPQLVGIQFFWSPAQVEAVKQYASRHRPWQHDTAVQ